MFGVSRLVFGKGGLDRAAMTQQVGFRFSAADQVSDVSAAAGPKNGQTNRERNFDLVPA